MTIKLLFGILSIIPAIFAYVYYIRDVLGNKTKPHAFSWLIWGVLAANGFFAQMSADAGAGAWVTGVTAATCLAIFFLAISKGDTGLTILDWILLSLALCSFVLLFTVDDKAIALLITLFATMLGFTMTFKKAYRKPDEETAKTFMLNAIKFLPGILALSSFSFLTVAYPLVALLGNAALAIFIWVRRKQLAGSSAPAFIRRRV